MADRYHFYVLDDDGRTTAHRERVCQDDPAAVEVALSLSFGQPVDVYAGDRCVAHLVQSQEAVLQC